MKPVFAALVVLALSSPSDQTAKEGRGAPGPHKILIELVNANHEVFPGQSRTVTFTIPAGASHAHAH